MNQDDQSKKVDEMQTPFLILRNWSFLWLMTEYK